ncbi:phage tail assembly chaperone [Erwinia mallotivora]|uniref:phage tail assembly chaperone n=1 Tax=Erwinia mallotivora TaxID=69222 RepID=UPI0021C12BE0|nr:phage tail assembly chaperone [Erwinia mallotivora]
MTAKKSALSLRERVLSPLSGFRIKSVVVPEWDGMEVKIREPSAQAWVEWNEIIYPPVPDDGTEVQLTAAQTAHRNLRADVVLFTDVLLDEESMPVFLPEDRELVQGIYGPVHSRLLKQALNLGTTQEDAGEK